MDSRPTSIEQKLLYLNCWYLVHKNEPSLLKIGLLLEPKITSLLHERKLASSFDMHCELVLQCCNSIHMNMTRNDVSAIAFEMQKFKSVKCQNSLRDVHLSQLIYRLNTDYFILTGKTLPNYNLFIREKVKRARVKIAFSYLRNL